MEQINTDDINSAHNNPNIIFKKRWKINDKLKIEIQKVLSRFMKTSCYRDECDWWDE